MSRSTAWIVLLWCVRAAAPAYAAEQAPTTAPELRAMVQQICAYQIGMLQRHDTRLQYRVQRNDRKGTTLRELIESHDGSVARLVQHNGALLTNAENDGERQRLTSMLGSAKLQQHENDEARGRSYGIDLLRAMPDAMRFTVAPQQAPVPDVADTQEVIDFTPNPDFHPTALAQQVLTQLSGRMWVDLNDHRLLRMELHNTGEVNLAWGLLAKIYPGGTVTYEQRKFQDLYVFTHIAMHLRVRELMVKTNEVATDTLASDFRRLPESPTADAAIRMLLAESVPTR